MIAHILSTGDEVLLGDVADTNAAFLARALKNLGIRVQKQMVVGDDVGDISEALKTISTRARVCVVTGGLGPTRDDVTAKACAVAAGTNLVLNRDALDGMTTFFKRRGFELTQANRCQAMIPETGEPLVNDHGTAPGFYIHINECLFFFLPGVPFEMKPMFTQKVQPVLKEMFKVKEPLMIARLTVFGLPESRVGKLLDGFGQTFPTFSLGFRADFPVIEVKIVAASGSENNIPSVQQMEQAKLWAASRLEGKVISMQGLSLAQEVGRLLVDRKKTLAIAESCTGGLIANMMTDVSGSSEYFLFSGVTYANDAKMKVLGVKQNTIIACGAVHEQTAEQMAVGARKTAGADVAVSTTGIAGPSGGTKDKPVGMVCIGLAGDSFSMAETHTFPFEDRLMNKQIFAATALEMLRRYLISETETA